MKMIYLILLLFLILPAPSFADDYVVDYERSQINFSSTHAGENFIGQFKDWQADISFDKTHLDASKATVIFNMSAVSTGKDLYDDTLPQSDWFDVKNYPQAKFQTSKILALENGGYMAIGELTLRGMTKEVSFNFTLDHLNDTEVHMRAEFPVYRLKYDIGRKSDASAEWVTDEIKVVVSLFAKAQTP